MFYQRSDKTMCFDNCAVITRPLKVITNNMTFAISHLRSKSNYTKINLKTVIVFI